jgi:hypothetical protein
MIVRAWMFWVFLGFLVGMGAIAVWDVLGPFAGACSTVAAFFFGAMVNRAWK